MKIRLLKLFGFEFMISKNLKSKIHLIDCPHAQSIKRKKYLTSKEAAYLVSYPQDVSICHFCR